MLYFFNFFKKSKNRIFRLFQKSEKPNFRVKFSGLNSLQNELMSKQKLIIVTIFHSEVKGCLIIASMAKHN